jgi:LysM repeat protein
MVVQVAIANPQLVTRIITQKAHSKTIKNQRFLMINLIIRPKNCNIPTNKNKSAMKKITVLFLALVTFYLSNAQNTLFIQYEANSCIQKFHFKVIEASSKSEVKEFYDFQVRLNATEKTVIRAEKVGVYKKADYKIKSKKITCAKIETHIFQSMVGKIRGKEQSIFFVEEAGENFVIYQGLRATYDIYNPNYFYSYSPDYSFKYSYANNYDPLQTLRYDDATGTVTLFAGKKQRDCRQQFGIYSIPGSTSEAQVNMEFIQDMGILEESNADGMFVLETVDGEAVNDYVNKLCNIQPKKEDIPVEMNRLPGENTAKGDAKATKQPQPKEQETDKVKILAKYKSDAPIEYNTDVSGQNTAKGDAAKVKILARYKGDTPKEYKQRLKGENTPKGGGEKTKKFKIIAPHKSDESSGKQEMNILIDDNNTPIPTEYTQSDDKKTVIINGLPEKYTVKEGDTLFFIAKKFEVSVKQLKTWNQIRDEKVYTGEELVVGVVTAPL